MLLKAKNTFLMLFALITPSLKTRKKPRKNTQCQLKFQTSQAKSIEAEALIKGEATSHVEEGPTREKTHRSMGEAESLRILNLSNKIRRLTMCMNLSLIKKLRSMPSKVGLSLT